MRIAVGQEHPFAVPSDIGRAAVCSSAHADILPQIFIAHDLAEDGHGPVVFHAALPDVPCHGDKLDLAGRREGFI